jgi:hypothetical protein
MANYGIETFLSRLVGRTDIEDALERLDMLTKEEIGMTVARNLAVTHDVDGNVRVVEQVTRGIDDNVRALKDGAQSSLIITSSCASRPIFRLLLKQEWTIKNVSSALTAILNPQN